MDDRARFGERSYMRAAVQESFRSRRNTRSSFGTRRNGPRPGQISRAEGPGFARARHAARCAIVAEFRVAVPGASLAAAAGGRRRSAHHADLEASSPARGEAGQSTSSLSVRARRAARQFEVDLGAVLLDDVDGRRPCAVRSATWNSIQPKCMRTVSAPSRNCCGKA